MESKRDEIRIAAEILALFTHDSLIHDRNAALRAMDEAARVWPGNPNEAWAKWFAEAATTLGLTTKTLTCTTNEALELARDGGRVVCYRTAGPARPDLAAASHESSEWLAAVHIAHGKFQILRTSTHKQGAKPISTKSLKSIFSRFAVDDQIKCVVVLPENIRGAHSNGDKLTPFKRLWLLLAPEAYDIWVVAVFAFVVSLLMLATPLAVEAIVNTVAFGRFVQPILILSTILLTFLGFQAAIRALQAYVIEIIQVRLFARIAGDLSFRLPRANLESVDGEHVPELVNRFFDVVTVQKVVAQLLLDGTGLVLNTLVGMAVLAFYHPWLLGFDLFLLAAIAVIVFVLGRGAVATSINESKQKYYMAGWLEEIARCPVTFRSEGGAHFAMERADRLIHGYLSARRSHFRIVLRQVVFALGLQAVASTLLLGLGGWLVVSGELTLGQLVAAELIVAVIVGSFAKVGKHLEGFYDLLASIDKLGTLFDIPIERRDGMLGTERTGSAMITLDSIAFEYPSGQSAFGHVTADIKPGERVAIVGKSGSGKSKLLDLMYGLRRPTSGSMMLDGFAPQDLRPDVLRRRVALARGTEVIHATVEENIHLHSESITVKEIRDALEGVGLHQAVAELKNGLDTMLSSDGSPLSKSQARRVGLARAVVRRPGVLLVDCVLDSLPSDEIDELLKYLLDPARPWTLIVATSREDIGAKFARQIQL